MGLAPEYISIFGPKLHNTATFRPQSNTATRRTRGNMAGNENAFVGTDSTCQGSTRTVPLWPGEGKEKRDTWPCRTSDDHRGYSHADQ